MLYIMKFPFADQFGMMRTPLSIRHIWRWCLPSNSNIPVDQPGLHGPGLVCRASNARSAMRQMVVQYANLEPGNWTLDCMEYFRPKRISERA
jgi:hypothetical protein